MKYYEGPLPGDERPIGGGAYNEDNIGGEAYNFLAHNGTVYGYFQPTMQEPYDVNLGRIDAKCTGDTVDGVLVVWFAKDPFKPKGQVIVGWYKDATVYRTGRSQPRNRGGYYVHTEAKNAVLLPERLRVHRVGHELTQRTKQGKKAVKKGNPGQSNAFYILDERGKAKDLVDKHNAWIREAIQFVRRFKGSTIKSRADALAEESILTLTVGSGGGYQDSVKIRRAVEAHAMGKCLRYYRTQGFQVSDDSRIESYDVLIRRDGQLQYVEVKGTQGAADSVILTRNEVKLNKQKRSVLFVVHSIMIDRHGAASGGKIAILDPWKIQQSDLEVIAYTYKLPNLGSR
ncbi:MAG: protein NO VEIN domain-containing protein [Gammaproteobacteria bacterium]